MSTGRTREILSLLKKKDQISLEKGQWIKRQFIDSTSEKYMIHILGIWKPLLHKLLIVRTLF